ncbi:(2,3-dihydroxybenzoyl)adenylate synthase [Serratia plymuthica]|uniref:(2,3-dihydroxybenzoyl)adenylate synthase n=1 Tax=Serratia plymuthica TaxID=82996 RepID=A0A2X4UZI1_SERPL|nr:(2,3-dihydroxybenzoyl)adenylate synthase [Serratia plymuthica]QPS19771.1 (2,3-dihydroxybenzoyl)adenylate synthase [Serratia plymuthica]QPS61483.1 (2,3-dihydroxybenzoyl)adenylate synthase [Serratia plymuthica]RKS61441.1 2,3-dihydroxybenzoate-AMP ligase [Serratia plymuthica]UNK29555.1 (2,3-dihydroxybenzoyl)adenylate synthase [Serratia plymuthica]CAI2466613.1 2,3-dihydroxybenzoate-AMP ligase [Serratia plymuthica]
MSIDFTPWPEALARRYRERGYWTDRPLTDIIARQAKNDAVALIDPQRSLSYRRLNQLSDRLAAALQRRGLHSGDTALVQLGNVVEFYVAFFALLKIGVVPVNALFSHQRNELKAYAAQIKPALLIADRQHGLFGNDEFLTAFRAENPSLRVVGLRSQAEGEQSLAAWLEEDAEDFIATPTPADQVAFFQLSGGSTGTPKLIPRTHNDYYYSIRRSVEICHFDVHTRYLCALPVAHNYPMSSPGVLGVFYGAGLVVFASDPDAGQCFRLIEQHQINVTALVPPAVTLWLQAIEEWGGQPLASLKLLQVGGAKLSETLAARIPAEIGCQLQQVFGMAEGLVNYTRLDDDDRHILTTQGCPMSPDDELWVADDEGNPLPVGQTGRLMTRGPYTFRGYYQSPEHNAAAFDKDGFYCSGDLISLTEDGYVKVEGRQKDQINRGGEKIAAEEIENLLLRHPEVINAALVSMPDELMGEKSCAFIIAASALKPVVLRRHLRAEGVAEFKLPDRFIQVDTLPLTPVGKVDKKRLRQRLETQSLTQAQGE